MILLMRQIIAHNGQPIVLPASDEMVHFGIVETFPTSHLTTGNGNNRKESASRANDHKTILDLRQEAVSPSQQPQPGYKHCKVPRPSDKRVVPPSDHEEKSGSSKS